MTTPSPTDKRLRLVRLLQALAEVAGGLTVAAACFMIWIPLGFLVLGVGLLLLGNVKVGS